MDRVVINHSKNMALLLCGAVVQCSVLCAFANVVDTTSQRSAALVMNHISDSWPECVTGAKYNPPACWMYHYFTLVGNHFPNASEPGGRIAISNATYTDGTNATFANQEVRRLMEKQVPSDGSLTGLKFYGAIPLALRLYYQASPGLLRPATKVAIADLAMDWLSYRSWAKNGFGSVQPIDGSENHDLLRKSSYLLGAQILVESGRGGELVVSDQKPVSEHLAAWEDHFVRYFRYHAQEGLNVEQSSPGYNSATLATYINIHDHSRNASVSKLAGDYLQLYHVDLALELTGTQRGGGKTRCYHGTYSDRGSAGVGHALAWLYGWHNESLIGSNCSHSGCESAFGSRVTSPDVAAYQATSAWRPLPVISAIAKRSSQQRRTSPVWWVSRRLGAGVGCGDTASVCSRVCQGQAPTMNGGYNTTTGKPIGKAICYGMSIGLGQGNQDLDGGLLHSTYIAAGFSLATLTRDYSRNYSALSVQNQWMGAAFASGPDERVHLLGNSSLLDKAWTVSMNEYNAVQSRAAFIAARPSMSSASGHSAFDHNAATTGTEIYFSASLWARVRHETNGTVDWLCVDSTDSDPRVRGAPGAYLCVGIVEGPSDASYQQKFNDQKMIHERSIVSNHRHYTTSNHTPRQVQYHIVHILTHYLITRLDKCSIIWYTYTDALSNDTPMLVYRRFTHV